MINGTDFIFWVLIALAVAALVIFFERLMDLRRAQVDWQDFIKGVRNLLETGSEEEAVAICEDAQLPVANVVAAAIRHRADGERAMREAVDAQGRAEVGRLDRRIAALAIIGQIAPLTGLLGVVLGFIRVVLVANGEALGEVGSLVLSSGSGIVSRADLMSAAAQALVPAALGLAIAIPVAVMYGMLRLRLDRLVLELEAAATGIVGYLAEKGAVK